MGVDVGTLHMWIGASAEACKELAEVISQLSESK